MLIDVTANSTGSLYFENSQLESSYLMPEKATLKLKQPKNKIFKLDDFIVFLASSNRENWRRNCGNDFDFIKIHFVNFFFSFIDISSPPTPSVSFNSLSSYAKILHSILMELIRNTKILYCFSLFIRFQFHLQKRKFPFLVFHFKSQTISIVIPPNVVIHVLSGRKRQWERERENEIFKDIFIPSRENFPVFKSRRFLCASTFKDRLYIFKLLLGKRA